MSGDPESSETSSAPSFSWSQVVRKDKKVAQHPTTTEVARDEAPAPALNLSGPPLSESLNKVQDKMNVELLTLNVPQPLVVVPAPKMNFVKGIMFLVKNVQMVLTFR